MKFEINPNELTTEQRTHVAAFITNWPRCAFTKMNNDIPLPRNAHIVEEDEHGVKFIIPTEEQRLDAEQKGGLVDVPHMQAANLNAIFGKPTPTESLEAYVQTLGSVPSVPLDKEGLPWDSRIHASTKTFIADGTWKLRRGVDPAEVDKVKAQLKELMAVPQSLVTDYHKGALSGPIDDVVHATGHVDFDPASRIPLPPLVTFTPTPIVPEGFTRVPGYEQAAVSTPAPKSHYLIDQQPPIGYVVPQTQVERASEIDIEKEAVEQYAAKTTVTLTDLIGRMSKAIAENRLTQAAVKEMCVKHGVSEFHLLSNRPDLLPLIDADMKAMGV